MKFNSRPLRPHSNNIGLLLEAPCVKWHIGILPFLIPGHNYKWLTIRPSHPTQKIDRWDSPSPSPANYHNVLVDLWCIIGIVKNCVYASVIVYRSNATYWEFVKHVIWLDYLWRSHFIFTEMMMMGIAFI